MNKWLISKDIKKIKEDQKNLTDKWSKIEAFEQIETPKLRLAAAQVLDNQRNEASEIAEDPEHLWNKMKYGILIRLFKQFECENPQWSVVDSQWPKDANLVGLRNDNKAIVLENGKDVIWEVEPIERELKTKWNVNPLQELQTVHGLDPVVALTALQAMEISMEIVSEVKQDLEELYCKNNILQYNYCLHSFRLGETVLDYEAFCPRTPIFMKYIKTATFGD